MRHNAQSMALLLPHLCVQQLWERAQFLLEELAPVLLQVHGYLSSSASLQRQDDGGSASICVHPEHAEHWFKPSGRAADTPAV